MSKFYLKYNIKNGAFILDTSRTSQGWDELLVSENKVSKLQGIEFQDKVNNAYKFKKRSPWLFEVEEEFDKMFHTCAECGYVTTRTEHKHYWTKYCKSCAEEISREKLLAKDRRKNRQRRIRRLRLHLNTPQGKVDAVPIEIIKENTALEMRLKGTSFAEVGRKMGLPEGSLARMFQGKSISRHILAEIASIIGVPLSSLIRKRRGVRIPLKHGVPAFWLDETFVIRYYEIKGLPRLV